MKNSWVLGLILAVLMQAGCGSVSMAEVEVPPVPTAIPTATLIPIPSSTTSLVPTATATATPTATPDPLLANCLRPPDDYARIDERGHSLSARTMAMLAHAEAIYGGSHDFRLAITQGSYNPGVVSASFGTHDGGGAVDLSVRAINNYNDILYDDLDMIIQSLRIAGFAAWVRYEDDLYPGSEIHIHAIAIGDADLSEAARLQLDGPAGYFRGYDGLPVDPPQPDRYGGPIVCPWMQDLGYYDLSGS